MELLTNCPFTDFDAEQLIQGTETVYASVTGNSMEEATLTGLSVEMGRTDYPA
jgi:hypothetical protein